MGNTACEVFKVTKVMSKKVFRYMGSWSVSERGEAGGINITEQKLVYSMF